MKFLLALCLAFVTNVCNAACPASATDIRGGLLMNADGLHQDVYAYWWCNDGYTLSLVWRGILGESITVQNISDAMAYQLGLLPDFINRPLNVPVTDPNMDALRLAALVASTTDANKPPAPHWIVSVNSLSKTRPAYALVNKGGVLSTGAVAGTANVGADCSCLNHVVLNKVSTYCEVSPAVVTLCNLTKP